MTTRSLVEVAGDRLRLNLHPGQTRAWESEKRFVAVIAGSQGGKTAFGPWWLNREIERRGAGDYIAATSSYDLFKLKMLPEIRNTFEHILGIGRYWSGDKIIELRNPATGRFQAKRADDPMWARIILRSASAEGGLESATASGAWLDEAGQDDFSLEAWEAVIRRLTLKRGRVLITTTPYNLGWLKQQIIDRESDDGDIEVINFPSIANPSFPKEEFERLQATMPKWKFDMFHRGILSRPPGMIYADYLDEYRESGGHLVAPFALPVEWPRFVGIDPGAVNTAMIWLAHDVSNATLYAYRESLEGGKSSKEHAHGAQALARKYGERVIAYHVGQKSESQQRIDWADAGVPNVKEPPFHDVESGIDKVIGLFREFRLYIFDTCAGLRDQLGSYRRKVDAAGAVTQEIKDKQKFHYLDALRYGVVGVVKQPVPLLVDSSQVATSARRKTDAPAELGFGLLAGRQGKDKR